MNMFLRENFTKALDLLQPGEVSASFAGVGLAQVKQQSWSSIFLTQSSAGAGRICWVPHFRSGTSWAIFLLLYMIFLSLVDWFVSIKLTRV